MRDAVLVIHQSGARLTVAVVDPAGRVEASQTRTFGVDRPADGLAEADAHEVWQMAREGIGAVLQQLGREAAGAVTAVAVVTEPGTALLWAQEHSRPVTPVVMGDDRRAEAVCRSFRERGWDDAFRRRTGQLPTASAAGFKVSELLAALPRGYSRAADGEVLFGSLASFFLLRLTGSRVHATSRSHALHSLLYSLDQDSWDVELLQVFNVPRACLPSAHPAAHLYGETTLGGRLPAPVPVAALSTTQETALYGAAPAQPGATLVTLGGPTGVVSYVGPERVYPPLPLSESLAVDAHPAARIALFALAPTDPGAWCVRLGLAPDEAQARVLAARVEEAGGIVFVPEHAADAPLDPVLGPVSADDRHAYFRGAPSRPEPARLARAVFERSVYQARAFVEAVSALHRPEPLVVDGAFAALSGLGQRLADLTGQPVHLLPDRPYAILGAARLARHAAGLGESEAPEVDAERLTPRLAADERAAQVSLWQDAVSA